LLRDLVADSSTLIALERVNLIGFLDKLDYNILAPKAVKDEIKKENILRFLNVKELKGRSLKNSRDLERLNIGKGEAQCCALANRLKLKFMICDDRKFLRQRFFSDNKKMQNIKILGFSFFLHIFHKKKLIKDIWKYFDKIIEINNWQRSEVLVANHTFLKGLGY